MESEKKKRKKIKISIQTPVVSGPHHSGLRMDSLDVSASSTRPTSTAVETGSASSIGSMHSTHSVMEHLEAVLAAHLPTDDDDDEDQILLDDVNCARLGVPILPPPFHPPPSSKPPHPPSPAMSAPKGRRSRNKVIRRTFTPIPRRRPIGRRPKMPSLRLKGTDTDSGDDAMDSDSEQKESKPLDVDDAQTVTTSTSDDHGLSWRSGSSVVRQQLQSVQTHEDRMHQLHRTQSMHRTNALEPGGSPSSRTMDDERSELRERRLDDEMQRIRHCLRSSTEIVNEEIAPKLDVVISKFDDIQRAWSLVVGRDAMKITVDAAKLRAKGKGMGMTMAMDTMSQTVSGVLSEDEEDEEEDMKTTVVHPSPMMRVTEIDEEEEVELGPLPEDCLDIDTDTEHEIDLEIDNDIAPDLDLHPPFRGNWESKGDVLRATPLTLSRTVATGLDRKTQCALNDHEDDRDALTLSVLSLKAEVQRFKLETQESADTVRTGFGGLALSAQIEDFERFSRKLKEQCYALQL